MSRRNTGSLLDHHDLRGQVPLHFYVHTCATCGVPIRRWRQHTLAAWYLRNGIEPKPWPIIWSDAGGTSDCTSTHSRRWRRENGLPDIGPGHLDSRHTPLDHQSPEDA